jgi:peroxiredoxin
MLFNTAKHFSKLLMLLSLIAVANHSHAARVDFAATSGPAKLTGLQAPDYKLPDITGVERTLSELRGKYVLIDFWGTWCGPCIAALPTLKAAYDKVDKTKVEFVGICSNCSDLEDFVEENNLPWMQLESDDIVTEKYHVTAYPTMFLVDDKGKVIGNSMNMPYIHTHPYETIMAYSSGDKNEIANLYNLKVEDHSSDDPNSKEALTSVGTSLPDLEIINQYAEKRNLKDYKGKTLLLGFWNSVSPNQMANMPLLRSVYQSIDRDKIEIVGICFDCPNIKEVARNNNLDWEQLVSVDKKQIQAIIDNFRLGGIPNILLINEEGVVVAEPKTMIELFEMEKIVPAIEKYLSNK